MLINAEKGISGWIYDIQRYAIHDGPGIRTLVFFKGCSLRCSWCCNPESQKFGPEMVFFPDKCIGCRRCIDICPFKAIEVKDEILYTHRYFCEQCIIQNSGNFPCSDICASKARVTMGSLVTVDYIVDQVTRDQWLYKHSGGGVTISGGEPLNQPQFLLSLLKKLKENWIHLAIETSGYGKWDDLKNALTYLNLIFFDIKAYEKSYHINLTGKENDVILRNALQLNSYLKKQELDIDLIYRIPLVPLYTCNEENVYQILDFIKNKLGGGKVEFMPYHRLGRGKYQSLGREYSLSELKPPSNEVVQCFQHAARERGLEVVTL